MKGLEAVTLTQSSYNEWYEYTTKDGDTFDALALDLYDDELLSTEIIAENPDFADVLIFCSLFSCRFFRQVQYCTCR